MSSLARERRREERARRGRRHQEPQHRGAVTLREPIRDRREQRDREREHHRVEVGEEHRLDDAVCPSGTGSHRRSHPIPASVHRGQVVTAPSATRPRSPPGTSRRRTTKTPAGAITANKIPADTGPSMPTAVPNPAWKAFADGSSSGGSSRAGHVSNAGRLNVYMPADRVANTYSGHTFGCPSEAFTAIASDISARNDVGPDHEPTSFHAVGDRTTDDREHEHRDQLAQAQRGRPPRSTS